MVMHVALWDCGFDGPPLMLVFFIWTQILRLHYLYVGLGYWHNINGGGSITGVIVITVLHVSFICLGNVMKWVGFVLY